VSELAVKTENLTKQYRNNKAIDSFSIELPTGGITGLIGRNGSGKTTLMKLCAGQSEISKGRLEVFGAAPMDNLPILSKLVYTYAYCR